MEQEVAFVHVVMSSSAAQTGKMTANIERANPTEVRHMRRRAIEARLHAIRSDNNIPTMNGYNRRNQYKHARMVDKVEKLIAHLHKPDDEDTWLYNVDIIPHTPSPLPALLHRLRRLHYRRPRTRWSPLMWGQQEPVVAAGCAPPRKYPAQAGSRPWVWREIWTDGKVPSLDGGNAESSDDTEDEERNGIENEWCIEETDQDEGSEDGGEERDNRPWAMTAAMSRNIPITMTGLIKRVRLMMKMNEFRRIDDAYTEEDEAAAASDIESARERIDNMERRQHGHTDPRRAELAEMMTSGLRVSAESRTRSK